MISSGDISFMYSGGYANSDPDLSLGGIMSATTIPGGLNNLYDNVSETESNTGAIDYRCFYVKNIGTDLLEDILYNASAELGYQTDGGATASFGIPMYTDAQQITIVTDAPVTGGDYTVSYDGETVTAAWDAMASDLQDGLNNHPNLNLSGVVCTLTQVSGATEQYIIAVTFEGDDNYRSHPVLSLVSNDLTGATILNTAITKNVDGAPMNHIAGAISSEAVAPSGITFGSTPISVGIMYPEDYFPVWIQRTTPTGTGPMSTDGFSLLLKGDTQP